MAGHTPGPWCVDKTNSLGAYGVWTDYATHPGHDGSGYGSQICSVITGCFPLTGSNKDERSANALLISAAPDLLAACEELLCWMREPGKTPEQKGAKVECQSDVEALARVAIKKARG